MHAARWHILLRFLVAMLPLGGVALWAALETPRAVARETAPEPPAFFLPSAAQEQQLALAVRTTHAFWAARQARAPAPRPAPAASLLGRTTAPATAAQAVQTSRRVRLSLLFLSAKERLAMIDDAVYGVGGMLPDGRVVETIDREGVVLSGAGRRERLRWQPPGRVELRQQSPERLAPAQSAEDIEEAPFAVLPPLYKKKYDPYGLYPYYNTYHYSRDYGKKW